MKTSNLVLALIALVFFAVILGAALHSQRTLEHGLPPRTLCASAADGFQKARAFAITSGGAPVGVMGTGSMVPFIPAAQDHPLETVVAYVVPVFGATFSEVKPGSLCIYAPKWAKGGLVMHGAAELDPGGWIMSGLHNDRSESSERMTAANFTAIAARVFTWPQ